MIIPRTKIATIIIAVLGALLLIAGIFAGVFYYKYQALATDPAVIAQQESKTIGAKVASLMEVPKDEMPSVATVTDKSKLQDQQFFAKTENGDKVVVYYSAGIAVLYRPSANKIIAVSPINATPTPTVTVSNSIVTPVVTSPVLTPTPSATPTKTK